MFSGHLAQLRASGANLSGELLDSHLLQNIYLDGEKYLEYTTAPLTRSLQSLELDNNRIHHIAGFCAKVFVSLVNGSEMSLDKEAVQKAVEDNMQVDLTATRITNTKAVAELFADGTLQPTQQLTQNDRRKGFSCRDITSSSLRVSPSLFWPQGLCACNEGFEGSGTQCHQCERGRYNQDSGQIRTTSPQTVFTPKLVPTGFETLQHGQDFNSGCKPCPGNSSTAEAGTTSVNSCICNVGRTRLPGFGVSGNCAAPRCQAGAREFERSMWIFLPSPC